MFNKSPRSIILKNTITSIKCSAILICDKISKVEYLCMYGMGL